MKPFSRPKLWLYIFGTLLGSLSIAVALHAATYNVFFNNVEQGEHSVSNPSLHVSDGKVTKNAGTTQAESVQTPLAESNNSNLIQTPTSDAATATQIPSGSSTTTVANITSNQTSQQRRMFRFGLLGHGLSEDSKYTQFESSSRWGGTIEAGFFPLRDFGVNFFTSANPSTSDSSAQFFYGGEVEFTPFRLNVFDLPNFIEASVFVGASNLGSNEGLWGTVHVGPRISINFGDRYGITSALRVNLTDRSQFSYLMGEAGFVVHL